MTREKPYSIKTELTIIGTGMTGLASALFASNRGISTILTGKSSSIHFATGLMDLMGVHPAGVDWEDPWAAMDQLRNDIPSHPYALISNGSISSALKEIYSFLNNEGLKYDRAAFRNVNVITSLGTIKKSYMIPKSMWNGVIALEKKAPTLLMDFTGLKIYSARQIKETLSQSWPGLDSRTVDFPGMDHLEEVFPEHIARELDLPETRLKLASIIKPIIKNHQYIGFPALLGMYRADEAITQFSSLLGIPVFEIATPPVSVPGIRLQETFLKGLEKNQNLHSLTEMIKAVETLPNGHFRLAAGEGRAGHIIETKGIILATGRFMGKGLISSRTGIREALFNIPVTQPEKRSMWHMGDLFHQAGHPVNGAGIEVDAMFRPLSGPLKPLSKNLFAAGSILAHSDWARMKCGSGVAVATAYGAIEAFCKTIKV